MAPSPGTNTGLSPPLERPCLQNCPAALWYFHEKSTKPKQPTNQNQNLTATQRRQQNPQTRTKTKKPQTNSILKTNKNPQATPASSLLPCDFVFAFSLCSPVQQIYFSNQFLISWVVFYFFLVPQMYFSCVKSAHKCLQVSNCPRCLSAVTALFPLAELQHRSQQLL